jgi:ribosomal protein S18 acetylase RimI-like enzyme
VRRARDGELDAALDVWRAANPATKLTQHPNRLRHWSREPGARFFVAVDNSRLIGTVFSLLGRLDDGAGEVVPALRHITGLSVLPGRQREGVGRDLVSALLADAQRDGCNRLTLWAHADNTPARRLFESFGFRPTGRRGRDDAGAETVHFELPLNR